jgi:hypothetical protein
MFVLYRRLTESDVLSLHHSYVLIDYVDDIIMRLIKFPLNGIGFSYYMSERHKSTLPSAI